MSVEGLMTSLCRNCGNCGLGFLKPIEEGGLIPEQNGRLICPPYLRYRFQSYRPSGRAVIIDALDNGDLELSDEVAREAYTCTLCGSCDEICSEDKVPAFRSLRTALVKAGLGPLQPSQGIDRKIERNGNIFGGKKERRSAWAKDLNLPKKGEILYFAGCFNSYMFPEVSRATINLLRQSGVDDIAFLGNDEVCCGDHMFLDGQGELGKKQASRLLSAIKESGAKTVITSCSSCYRTFKTDFVEMFGELPFEVIHTAESLWRSIDNGELVFKTEIRKKVCYHDPCGLGRWLRVFEEPRGVIQAIPGIEYIEMPNNRTWSWCCGGGMPVNYFATEDLANWSAEQRLKEAIEAGADALITACPHCVANFRRTVKQTGLGIEVLDLTVLADSAV